MIRWIVIACAVAACGPSSGDSSCKQTILPGDLVITEVFADSKAPTGGTGTDTGKEWFEIFNASDHPIEVGGMSVTHSRPDDSSAKTHVMGDVTIAPGQYFTLGNATSDLIPAYIDYGYSADLGDFFNTDGGKLALRCGSDEIDEAQYDGVKEGHSRELTSAQPPDYTVNDDLANWCEGDATEFDTGNFGTPGQDNDCVPVVQGQCNDNGTMRDTVAPQAGDLVITEVMPGPSKVSDALGEWFEARVIHDVDLNGIGLDRAGDTSKPEIVTSPDCIHVTAGQNVVFAHTIDMTMNGGIPQGTIAGTFKFALVAGSPTAPGDVQIVAGDTVIDSITWTHSASGASLQLDPDLIDPIANDSESNFCDATATYGLGDLGTPSLDNTQCTLLPPPGMCSDNGSIRAIVKPAAGQLVITEIMANPKVEPAQEWFEITNTGATAFDLNELGLDRAGDSRVPDVIHSADCKSVAAAGFALFARSTDPAANGMLAGVDATFGFSLVNTTGDVQVLDGTTVLDAVAYASTPGDGISSQLDPDHFTTADNDVAANFCASTAPYGDMTNLGTPKAANAQCP
jgi:hypothetical protein